MLSQYNPSLNEITEDTRDDMSLPIIHSEVKSKIDKAQQAQKLYYNKGRRPAVVYNNGDLVKITKVVFSNDGKSTKLMPK